MNIKKLIASAVAGGAILVNTALPVFAQTTIQISGNGTGSTNDATVSFTTTTTVVQSNNADVENKVNASADTGGNKAEDNTGGDVSIDTGDAEVDVKVDNTLNSNSADVNCCPSGDIDVLISGNGSDTKNNVDLRLVSETGVFQENKADVENKVYANSETGDNKAEDNTGGDVSITTGDAKVGVALSTAANMNSAKVGGSGSAGSLSARILGNGTDSDNDIQLGLLSGVLVSQANKADIENEVWAKADTGDNEAEDNTGGSVEIVTGDAEVDVTIDNWANFNWADVDCGGCLLEDFLVKIADNGSDSDNDISAVLGQGLEVFQGNCAEELQLESLGGGRHHRHDCELENSVKAEGETGDNKAEDNTGNYEGSDPSVETGDSDVEVELENSGNINILGDGPEFPELPEVQLEFGVNWAAFWVWVSGMMS